MKELSGLAQTIYAEMLEQALSLGIHNRATKLGGSFVQKAVDGQKHFYYQYREMGQKTVQAYLGPDNEKTRSIIDRVKQYQEDSLTSLENIRKLQAVFIQLGGHAIDSRPFRVIKGFADAGILRPEIGFATIVGTHAFSMMGNVLGVSWDSSLKTADVDFAADDNLEIAVAKPELSAPTALEQLNMGFIPIPPMNPKHPFTSYMIRRKELRVDLVTTKRGKSDNPVPVRMFGAPAQPLPFMDYLIGRTIPAMAMSKKDVVALNLPEPSYFAVHKLILSENRPAAFRTKAIKDRDQARQLIGYFREHSPYEFEEALGEALNRGPGWQRRILTALDKLENGEEGRWAKDIAKAFIRGASEPGVPEK